MAKNKKEFNGFYDSGAAFDGKLSFEGTMRIDGSFEGTIHSSDTLIVGESGEVEGDIEVKNLTVNGTLRGTVKVDNKIEILEGARVFCEMTASPNLAVEPGAIFEGKINMPEYGNSRSEAAESESE